MFRDGQPVLTRRNLLFGSTAATLATLLAACGVQGSTVQTSTDRVLPPPDNSGFATEDCADCIRGSEYDDVYPSYSGLQPRSGKKRIRWVYTEKIR